MTPSHPTQSGGTRKSTNVLSLGDEVRVCFPWASCSFIARILGFEGEYVRIEAADRSDDLEVENEWVVPWGYIGKVGLMDDRYA